MAMRKRLLSACGAVLAGGLICSSAEAALTVDLRLVSVPAGATLVNNKLVNIADGAAPAGDFLIDVYLQVTDSTGPANDAQVRVWGATGSFRTTATDDKVKGNISPNGSSLWDEEDGGTNPSPTLVGIRVPLPNPLDGNVYEFTGNGATAGTQQTLDGDADLDLGSNVLTDATGYVAMRSSDLNGAPNSTGTAITDGKEWLAGRIKFNATSLNAAAANLTELNWVFRTENIDNTNPGLGTKVADEAGWWFEDNVLKTGTGAVIGTDLKVGSAIQFNVIVAPSDPEWNGTAGDGLWNTTGNWTAPVPTAGKIAIFGSLPTTPGAQAVTVTTATAGSVKFNSTTHSYAVSGGTLTLDNGGGAASIMVDAGNHSLTSAITSTANINVTGAAGTTLTLGKVTTTGVLNITAPTVTLAAQAGGPLAAPTGTLKLGGLTLGAGTTLDIKDNDIVTTGSVATYKALIISGYNGGAWNGPGIVTSLSTDPALGGKVAAIGYAQGNDPNLAAALGGLLSGEAFGASDVLIKYTYQGDADLDGDVDGVDVGKWALGFTGSLPLGTGPGTWTTGDWDYDGDVDGVDVGKWALHFTGSLAIGSGLSVDVPSPINPAAAEILSGMGITVNVVPEPATVSIIGLGALALLGRRARKAR